MGTTTMGSWRSFSFSRRWCRYRLLKHAKRIPTMARQCYWWNRTNGCSFWIWPSLQLRYEQRSIHVSISTKIIHEFILAKHRHNPKAFLWPLLCEFTWVWKNAWNRNKANQQWRYLFKFHDWLGIPINPTHHAERNERKPPIISSLTQQITTALYEPNRGPKQVCSNFRPKHSYIHHGQSELKPTTNQGRSFTQ